MVIIRCSESVCLNIQLCTQIEVGIGFIAVLMLFDMTKTGWEVVITVKHVKHFSEIKFSGERGIRIRMGVGLVIPLASNYFQIIRLIGQEGGDKDASEVLFEKCGKESGCEHATSFSAERVGSSGAATMSLD